MEIYNDLVLRDGASITATTYYGDGSNLSGIKLEITNSIPLIQGLNRVSTDSNIELANGTWSEIAKNGPTLVSITPQQQMSSSCKIITSLDNGATWSLTYESESFGLFDITYGNGKFVACGSNGNLVYSTDGISWTVIKGPTAPISQYNGYTWSSIEFGQNVFAMCSLGGPSEGLFASSSDGITWQLNNYGSDVSTWNDITFDGTYFYAISPNTNYFSKSSDGIVWSDKISLTTFGGPDGGMQYITARNGKIVVNGGGADSYYSTDSGNSWTYFSMPTQYGFGNFIYNDDATILFRVMYGGPNDQMISYSIDNGLNFTMISGYPDGNGSYGCIYFDNKFAFLVGNSNQNNLGYWVYSIDDLPIVSTFSLNEFYDLITIKNNYMNLQIKENTDAITQEISDRQQSILDIDTLSAVQDTVLNKDKVIYIDQDGSLTKAEINFTTGKELNIENILITDITTQLTSGLGHARHGIVLNDIMFLHAGYSNVVKSSDGINWSNAFNHNSTDLRFGDFVLVGTTMLAIGYNYYDNSPIFVQGDNYGLGNWSYGGWNMPLEQPINYLGSRRNQLLFENGRFIMVTSDSRIIGKYYETIGNDLSTLTEKNIGFPELNVELLIASKNNTIILAGKNMNGIYVAYSTDDTVTWNLVQVDTIGQNFYITVQGDYFFLNVIQPNENNMVLYKSLDGISWQKHIIQNSVEGYAYHVIYVEASNEYHILTNTPTNPNRVYVTKDFVTYTNFDTTYLTAFSYGFGVSNRASIVYSSQAISNYRAETHSYQPYYIRDWAISVDERLEILNSNLTGITGSSNSSNKSIILSSSGWTGPNINNFYQYEITDAEVNDASWIESYFANTDNDTVINAGVLPGITVSEGSFIIESDSIPTKDLHLVYKIII